VRCGVQQRGEAFGDGNGCGRAAFAGDADGAVGGVPVLLADGGGFGEAQRAVARGDEQQANSRLGVGDEFICFLIGRDDGAGRGDFCFGDGGDEILAADRGDEPEKCFEILGVDVKGAALFCFAQFLVQRGDVLRRELLGRETGPRRFYFGGDAFAVREAVRPRRGELADFAEAGAFFLRASSRIFSWKLSAALRVGKALRLRI